jgi:hypothetical protein
MPYDRIDPRDETFEDRTVAEPEGQDEELSSSLEALFSMFGGQVVEPSDRD